PRRDSLHRVHDRDDPRRGSLHRVHDRDDPRRDNIPRGHDHDDVLGARYCGSSHRVLVDVRHDVRHKHDGIDVFS
ncbi:hypothetical protein ABN228_21960, partial [Providencia rettgeri]|uniref:hypothetical protein n=1 Tax=Providencia rettgeri TaxID=587 RepID=UPI0032DBC8A2